MLFSVLLGTVLLSKLAGLLLRCYRFAKSLFSSAFGHFVVSSQRQIEQRILAQALGVPNLNKFTEEKRETLRNI